MKRYTMAALAAAVLSVGLWTGSVSAADATKDGSASSSAAVKTVSGKSGCSTCDGVTAEGHSILLTDKEGNRWVLLGSGPAYNKVHDVRMDGKKITATLAGEPVVKKGVDGKDYREVKISDIKIDA